MRPKLTSAVRRGLAAIAARSGAPLSSDEARAQQYAAAMGSVRVLNPRKKSGGHKPKRKRRVPKGLR